MTWFSSPTKITITLLNEPENGKYSPVNPVIKGRISVSFSEETEKICAFSCGLSGVASMEYYVLDRQPGLSPARPGQRRVITDRQHFFNVYKVLSVDQDKYDEEQSSKIGIPAFKYKAGDEYTADFELEFPDAVYLPSSLQSWNPLHAYLSISYDIYVEVFKVGGLFSKKPKICNTRRMPVLFQSGKDPHLIKTNNELFYNKQSLYENKVKKFYFDEDTKALIPTALHNNHTKSRFIRKLWNDNYKKENYNRMTKSMNLELDFSTKSTLNLSEPLSSQFHVSLTCDLKSLGMESNQSTDFVLNGQSTHLGVFQIKSLQILALCHITAQCQQYVIKDTRAETLCSIKFDNLFIDVKDFEYDKMNSVYKQDLSMDLLAEAADKDLNKNLLELMEKKSVICTGDIPNWFDSSVTVKFSWCVTDGMEQSKTVEFFTESTPDVLLEAMHSSTSQNGFDQDYYMPPPTYDTSQDDKKIDLC